MLNQTIEQFTKAIIAEHPQCERWLHDYSTDFETQILSADPTEKPDWFRGLEPGFADKESFYRDRPTCWIDGNGNQLPTKIRIPYESYGIPRWSDRAVRGQIDRVWHYFGTSGWNWRDLQSHWVGYDFDAIAGHSEGLSDEQLNEVRSRALQLPYVTARTSKSGNGLHLLVYFDDKPTTRNHGQHALLAKDVLNRMSKDCGYDFSTALDCCGLILWHFMKGMSANGCTSIN
jgi:hypothetical protein